LLTNTIWKRDAIEYVDDYEGVDQSPVVGSVDNTPFRVDGV